MTAPVGQPKVVAAVFARGGSVGLPRKALAVLGGRPLIGWAVESALETPGIDEVFVSTDDVEIAETAARFGATIPFLRPAELATSESPEIESWRHLLSHFAAEGVPVQALVSVPVTAPLRSAADIRAAMDAFAEGAVDIVITVTPAARNPYFDMVTLDSSGRAQVVMDRDELVTRRQDAPPVYDITPVAYVADPTYLLSTPAILAGNVGAVVVPRKRAVDIDAPEDLAYAEFLLEREESGEQSMGQGLG